MAKRTKQEIVALGRKGGLIFIVDDVPEIGLHKRYISCCHWGSGYAIYLDNSKEVIGQIEYQRVINKDILYIDELAIFGDNKRKGFGEKAVWNLFYTYKNIKNIVGLSTNDAIPFWKRIGACLSKVKENGDCFFILNKWYLYNYLRRNKMRFSKTEKVLFGNGQEIFNNRGHKIGYIHKFDHNQIHLSLNKKYFYALTKDDLEVFQKIVKKIRKEYNKNGTY